MKRRVLRWSAVVVVCLVAYLAGKLAMRALLGG